MNTLSYHTGIVVLACAGLAGILSPNAAFAQNWRNHTLHQAFRPQSWVILGKPGAYVNDSIGNSLNRDQLRALVGEPVRSGTREADMYDIITSSLRGQSRLNQLVMVNTVYNQQPYRTDQELYGVVDHWATVGEFLANGGDCEDYAIAKYRTLVRAGFPESSLRIVLVDDMITHSEHAVLAARLGNATYILDNQSVLLRPETSLTYYHPIYSLNGSGVWYHGQTIPPIPARQIAVTNR